VRFYVDRSAFQRNFYVVESECFGMLSGFAGKEVSKEEGEHRLVPSSTMLLRCDVEGLKAVWVMMANRS
jgi:hypothetical protein